MLENASQSISCNIDASQGLWNVPSHVCSIAAGDSGFTLPSGGTLAQLEVFGSAACCNSATLLFTPSCTFCSTRAAIWASWSLITSWTITREAGSSPASLTLTQPDRPTARHSQGPHQLQTGWPPLHQLQP